MGTGMVADLYIRLSALINPYTAKLADAPRPTHSWRRP